MRSVPLVLVVSLGVGCVADNRTYYGIDALPDQAPGADLSGPPPAPQPDSYIFSQADAMPAAPDAGAPAPTDTGLACNAGEYAFGSACYSAPGFSRSNLMDYATAVQVCAANGAKVVSIHSKDENEFLYELLDKLPFLGPSSAWIGLKRTGGGAGKASFAWEDGSPVAYTRWAPGEPNNEAGDENCTVIWGPGLKGFPDFLSKWNDAPCDEPGRTTVLCKRVP